MKPFLKNTLYLMILFLGQITIFAQNKGKISLTQLEVVYTQEQNNPNSSFYFQVNDGEKKFVGKRLENIQPLLEKEELSKEAFIKACQYNSIYRKQATSESLIKFTSYLGAAVAVVGGALYSPERKSMLPLAVAGGAIFVTGMVITFPLVKKKQANFESFKLNLITAIQKYNSKIQ